MTVGVAAICEQGKYVVMAADTMQSIGRPYLIEFEHRSRTKITKGPFDKCAVSVAGLTAASSELLAAVAEQVGKFPARPMREMIGLLERCYQELRVRKIEEEFLWRHGMYDLRHLRQWESELLDDVVLDFQKEIESFDPELELLVGAIGEDGAHLHVVKNPGKSECFDALGYCAIGSGGRHALTSLVRSGCSPNVSLPDGVMIVLEAKIHAERAPGVGAATDLAVLSSQGMISLSRDNVQRLRQAYEQRVHAEANGEPDPRAASILERVAGAVLRNEPYPAEPGPPSAPFT